MERLIQRLWSRSSLILEIEWFEYYFVYTIYNILILFLAKTYILRSLSHWNWVWKWHHTSRATKCDNWYYNELHSNMQWQRKGHRTRSIGKRRKHWQVLYAKHLRRYDWINLMWEEDEDDLPTLKFNY